MGVIIRTVPKSYTIERPYDARLVLERLAWKFGIEAPGFRFSHGRRFSIYRPSIKTIITGPNAHNGLTSGILHTFTHYLCDTFHVDHAHSALNFLETMWKVVMIHFDGDPTRYPWYGEANPIFEFGRNRCRDFIASQE